MKRNQLFATLLLLGFLLGIHNGKVALWKDNEPQPCRIFPYSAALLPRDIRNALEAGIHIQSEADLDRLLESLCS